MDVVVSNFLVKQEKKGTRKHARAATLCCQMFAYDRRRSSAYIELRKTGPGCYVRPTKKVCL